MTPEMYGVLLLAKKYGIDYDNIDLECKQVWDLLCTGKVKGCFQLDKTAKSWLSKIRPQNILELAALISLIRPGCMNAKMDGRSMTQHYLDRKNGEYAQPIHSALEPILKDTYQVIVYQEQTIAIAKEVAGYNLSEADILRKAMGKKDAKLMSSLKKSFVEGCINVGKVDKEDDALEIFDVIEKSNRYSFNKSHAVAYAFMGYWSAYVKTYDRRDFFCSWLKFSHDKKKDATLEVVQLINDAAYYKETILPPSLQSFEKEFHLDLTDPLNSGVRFGLCDIKSVGEKQIAKIKPKLKGYRLHDAEWYDFLIRFGKPTCINRAAFIALVSVGAMDYMEGTTRQEKLLEYETWNHLTDKEQEWVMTRSGICPEAPISQTKNAISTYDANLKVHIDTKNDPFKKLSVAIEALIQERPTSAKRKKTTDAYQTLMDPPYAVNDNVKWIMRQEKSLMGLPFSTTRLDHDIKYVGSATCAEFDKMNPDKVSIVVEISEEREYNIKSGPNKGMPMCFLAVKDQTSSIDNVLVFSKAYDEYGHLLYVGNTVLLDGYKDDDVFKVNKVLQA